MTNGEQGNPSAIRVTLHGDAARDVDVEALKKWLERERSLEAWVKDNKLRIQERPRTDARDSGTAMGVGMEILLVVSTVVTTRLFDELLAATKAGVAAWLENRRTVEPGEPPCPEITPLAPPAPLVRPQAGDGAPGTGTPDQGPGITAPDRTGE